MTERTKVKIWISALFVCGSIGYWTGSFFGYRDGQIDYAREKVEYTIISERIVRIMGKAPLPPTKLFPIQEKTK